MPLQLAMKFLEKDELSNYTFQNDFMRPFVFANATNYNTADHVAPTVTAVVTPAPNAAGWNNTNATVTLTAVDGPATPTYLASGLASITGWPGFISSILLL